MAITKGTNSFVNLSEANSYFEDRLDVAAWNNAECEYKEQALVTASLTLDQMRWKGSVVSATQALAFPRRDGSFKDHSRGLSLTFDANYTFSTTDETETSLKRDIRLIRRATYELAYHLLNNDGLLDSTGEIKEVGVGSISLGDIKNASTTPRVVRRIIEPMLNKSGNSWWGY